MPSRLHARPSPRGRAPPTRCSIHVLSVISLISGDQRPAPARLATAATMAPRRCGNRPSVQPLFRAPSKQSEAHTNALGVSSTATRKQRRHRRDDGSDDAYAPRSVEADAVDCGGSSGWMVRPNTPTHAFCLPHVCGRSVSKLLHCSRGLRRPGSGIRRAKTKVLSHVQPRKQPPTTANQECLREKHGGRRVLIASGRTARVGIAAADDRPRRDCHNRPDVSGASRLPRTEMGSPIPRVTASIRPRGEDVSAQRGTDGYCSACCDGATTVPAVRAKERAK